MASDPKRPRIALVLAGGAARGAYEVGVIQHLLEEVPKSIGRPVPLDILCGTSVGAINACSLAAFADDPVGRARRLVTQWLGLRVGHVVRIDGGEIFATVRGFFGGAGGKKGALLDPTGLQRIVATQIPFGRIGDHIRAGHLEAITVSTTHIASGRTCVFLQKAEGAVPTWRRDPTIVARAAALTAHHALASAAIPFVFPAVEIDGEFHCDGGLRQNVPLSPARRLGADGMIVVSPKYAGPPSAPPEERQPTPMFLLGKTLNSLMLDRIDNDIDRLQRITALLDAGTHVYGNDFVDRMDRDLMTTLGHGMRPIRAVLVRTSQNIARMAVDFVRTPAFESRASGMLGAILRRMSEGSDESDLLSYLLFDGEFARQLMEVGRKDARAQHEELCAFFERLRTAETV